MILKVIHSTKKDGNMHPKFDIANESEKNRKKFFKKNNIDYKKNLYIKIKYSDEIFILNEEFLNKNPDLSKLIINTDCIITNIPNIFLYLPFADCIPLTIYDKKNSVLAFVHMGWQSTELDLHKKVLKTMEEKYNTDIKDIKVNLGSSIKGESYILENPSQLKYKHWWPYLKNLKENFYSIDLPNYIIDSFKSLGVNDVEVSNINTVKNLDYYSHYRCIYIDNNEKEGRFIVGAVME